MASTEGGPLQRCCAHLLDVAGRHRRGDASRKKRAVDHLCPGTTQRNTQACSTAATADFLEAANNHVTYNRCAIALKYCKEASRYVKSRPNTRMGILEISYDASDQPATIDGDPAIYEMVMVTMKLTWFGEGRRHTEVINISCPPVFCGGYISRDITSSSARTIASQFPDASRKMSNSGDRPQLGSAHISYISCIRY